MIPAALFFLLNFYTAAVKIDFLYYLIFFSLLFFIFHFLRYYRLDHLLPLLIGGISPILFLYGILQKFIIFPIYAADANIPLSYQAILKKSRIYSLFTLPTLYAFVCAVLILTIFHLMLQYKRYRLFWFLLLLAGLYNLLLCQSFGGWIYLGVGFLFYFVFSGKVKFRHLAPFAMIMALFFFINIGLRYREAKGLEPVKLRFSNWLQAVRLIQLSPLTGVGLGNYQTKVSYVVNPVEARSLYAHNFPLQLMAEIGIIIPLFLLFTGIIFRKKIMSFFVRNNLYISIILMTVCYNMIDIGLYFFSAGIIFAITLSQLFPGKNSRGNRSLIMMIICGCLMFMGAISDHYRRNGDFLFLQKKSLPALTNYKRSLLFNPFNYKTLIARANIYFQMKDLNRVENTLKRVFGFYADDAYSNYLQSCIDFKKGRYLDAFSRATIATQKNRISWLYKSWYEHLKTHIQTEINSTGN